MKPFTENHKKNISLALTGMKYFLIMTPIIACWSLLTFHHIGYWYLIGVLIISVIGIITIDETD